MIKEIQFKTHQDKLVRGSENAHINVRIYLQGRMMLPLNDQNYPLRAIIQNELGSLT